MIWIEPNQRSVVRATAMAALARFLQSISFEIFVRVSVGVPWLCGDRCAQARGAEWLGGCARRGVHTRGLDETTVSCKGERETNQPHAFVWEHCVLRCATPPSCLATRAPWL